MFKSSRLRILIMVVGLTCCALTCYLYHTSDDKRRWYSPTHLFTVEEVTGILRSTADEIENRTTNGAGFNSSRTITDNESKRLVLTFRISEQMTMAMSHTYQLARVATEWRAKTVLPFLQKDCLTGLPARNTMSLGLLYNLSMLKDVSKKHSILPFIDFETFLKESDRKNVYFFHVYYFGEGGSEPVAVEPSFERKLLKECSSKVELLNREAKKRGLPKFDKSRIHCCKVRSSVPLVPQDFIEGCNVNVNTSFTILFDYWRGYSYEQKKVFRLFLPNYTNKKKVPWYDLPYSNSVLKGSEDFMQQLTNGEDFIGVHIRARKLYNAKRKNFHFDDRKCIVDLLKKLEEVSKSHPHINHTVYVGDGFVKKYTDLLKDVAVSHFNPLKSHLVENAAFIAQVEQSLISKAKILLMCGGGSFEESIKMRYLKNNPRGIIYKVCG